MQTKWEIDVSLDESMRCNATEVLPNCVHNVPLSGSGPSVLFGRGGSSPLLGTLSRFPAMIYGKRPSLFAGSESAEKLVPRCLAPKMVNLVPSEPLNPRVFHALRQHPGASRTVR
jgi:hypothetical protein